MMKFIAGRSLGITSTYNEEVSQTSIGKLYHNHID